MDFLLKYGGGSFSSNVMLPESKSVLARMMIIGVMSPHRVRMGTSSGKCDDVAVLHKALKTIGRKEDIDIAGSGTAMRFLTAYAAAIPGITTRLYGDQRMSQRPVAPLVDALRTLGADIGYLGKDGFPPLLIHGKRLAGGEVSVSGEISSQFISALLLIAPVLPGGLSVRITGSSFPSRPYVEMTCAVMERAGVKVSILPDGVIRVPHAEYLPITDISGFRDWSAASYFYELAALSGEPVILSGLGDPVLSIQGDARVAEIFRSFGVETEIRPNGDVVLLPGGEKKESVDIDMSSTPDLVPAVAVTAALLSIPFSLSGIGNLRIKECDRLSAISSEMLKLGIIINVDEDSLRWNGRRSVPDSLPVIDTYGDHRIAMCMTPAVCCFPSVVIRDVQVVKKSFPKFWHQVSRVGVKYFLTEQGADS